MRKPFVESLESRTLFAGVTLITHGRDGHLWGFVQTAADAITKRMGGPGEAPQYVLTLTPAPGDGHLVPTITHVNGTGTPQSSSSGEIILLVDWTSIDKDVAYSLPYVASVITDVFMNSTVGGVRLAELPLHGLSISRGTGLLDEISKSLGRSGIWVDQETYTDPNPVGVMGDAPPTVYDNVAFVDNYWRWDLNPNNTSTNGRAVAGAYNLNLQWLNTNMSGWALAHIVPGGYYIGTTDLTTTWGGEGPVYTDWYGTTADKPARDQTGFLYTSIAGGTRPLSGVWSASGGSGTRTATGQSGSQWANVTDVTVTSGNTFASGQAIQVGFIRQDRDSSGDVTLYLDSDRNPYNGAFAKTLGTTTFQASSTIGATQATGSTDNVLPGSYWVCVKTTDAQGHVRYSYSKQVTVTGTGSTTYLSDLIPTAAINGWGAMEKDRSNGESGATDGNVITLNSTTYAKGLGVHAMSDLTYALNGQYTQFSSDIGVDDEKGSNGTVIFQVYLDGIKVYDSGVMTNISVTKTVNLDVTGASTLRLVVTNGGDNNDNDHADWAGARLTNGVIVPPPPPPPPAATTYVSSLTATSATNGWGNFENDRSNGEQGATDGRTISINGKSFARGIGVHAGSDITYSLAGQYSQFLSEIGVDDEVGNNGSVVFQVFVDGIKVFDSGLMTGASANQLVAVDLQGKSTLRLVVTNGGDGNAYDHGDWGDARLTAGAPVAVPTAPAGLLATYNNATGKVDLIWSAGASDHTGFRIERKLGAGGAYASIGTVSAATLTFTDSGPLTASSTYFYRVLATNAGGDSLPSNEPSVITPAPPPPSPTTYLSDLTATSATNGWGAYEKDRSNGETGATDGNAITLNGVTYAKGLGVHSASDITFNLNKQYQTFISDIGVDDEKGTRGSVTFQVYVDGVKVYDSGVMTNTSVTKTVNLSVANASTLRLVVTNGGDNNDSDHADWAGARLLS